METSQLHPDGVSLGWRLALFSIPPGRLGPKGAPIHQGINDLSDDQPDRTDRCHECGISRVRPRSGAYREETNAS